MVFLWSLIICAGSTVNNEQEEFNIVQGAILQYQKNTNEFPTSWDDLWNNPASRPIVESLDKRTNFGRRTDMIESFRFIASGTTIRFPDDGSTVIGMMTRPMRPPPEIRRRFLIVRLIDGTRGLKQLPEDVLQKIFSDIGLSLADYTGPNGNWAPETRFRPVLEVTPPSKEALAAPSMDYSTVPRHHEKLRPVNPNELMNATAKKATPFPWWIIASSFGLLVMVVVVWLKVRKTRSKP